MHERIKKLRKALNLTQQEFADRIKIKRGAFANYEVGRNEPIDAVIFSICREFNVSEIWLRTGSGNMFQTSSRDAELEEFTNRLLKDEPESFRRRLVTAMARLNESQWEAVSAFVDGLAAEDPAPDTWDGKTREELHAELDRRLDEEKERALSEPSASALSPDMMDAG